MKKVLILLLSFMSLTLFGQHKGTRWLRGEVINQVSGLGLKDVQINTGDSVFVGTTNSAGGYFIKIPKNTDLLIFSCEGYASHLSLIKRNTFKLNVELKRLEPDPDDLPHLKNSLSILPLKFITGALGLRYERFVKTKYSIGFYADYYYRGRQYFGTEQFKGIKVTPHLRYYITRNKSYGFYGQAGLIISYFDFHNLNYNAGDMEYHYSTSPKFWTGGFNAAIGIADIVKNSGHFLVDISIGLQIMPQPYPTSVKGPHDITYTHNPGWWYAGGPGSLVEIKLAFGGIF